MSGRTVDKARLRVLPSRRSGLRALGFGRTGLVGLHLLPVVFAWLAGQLFGSALMVGDGLGMLASCTALIGVVGTGANLLHRYAIDPHLRREFLSRLAPEDLIFPPHLQPGWPGRTDRDDTDNDADDLADEDGVQGGGRS
jgi:hypothetical protein